MIFFFAGTGEDGSHYAFRNETMRAYPDDVIRVYIKGCQEENVGNGIIMPDLDIASNHLRHAFEGNTLNIGKLRQNLGDGLYDISDLPSSKTRIKVDSILLEGFSRGAVTTFATAKKLDDLNIPIHIIANQPVPGELTMAGRLFKRYNDLRHCQNIRSASTFLASHDLEQGFLNNMLFKQMVAQFSPKVHTEQILFPHQNHLDWFRNSPIEQHISRRMAANGFAERQDEVNEIKKWYELNQLCRSNPSFYFTPDELRQPIFGAKESINQDPIYLEMITALANKVLTKAHVRPPCGISTAQAKAIISVNRLFEHEINKENDNNLYHLIVKNSASATQFCQAINTVTAVCEHLSHQSTERSEKQSKLIYLHANQYKKSVFMATFEYLSLNKPTIQNKKILLENIKQAEYQFRSQALDLDEDKIRVLLKFITNFITHITGLALIVNTIHKVQTGNWLFFQNSHATNVVRDTQKSLFKTMEHHETHEPSPVDTELMPSIY